MVSFGKGGELWVGAARSQRLRREEHLERARPLLFARWTLLLDPKLELGRPSRADLARIVRAGGGKTVSVAIGRDHEWPMGGGGADETASSSSSSSGSGPTAGVAGGEGPHAQLLVLVPDGARPAEHPLMRLAFERFVPCMPLAFVLDELTAEAPRGVEALRILPPTELDGEHEMLDESQF